jgi:hypothetical protein
MRRTIFILTLALSASGLRATAAGETVTYTGNGTYTTTRSLLPLSNGGAVLHTVTDTVATVQPSESGFMYGDCAGLAYLSPEDEMTIKTICNFDLTPADGFVVSLEGSPKAGVAVQVLGGRGKFEKASGSGKARQTYLEGDRGSYEFEFKITTP